VNERNNPWIPYITSQKVRAKPFNDVTNSSRHAYLRTNNLRENVLANGIYAAYTVLSHRTAVYFLLFTNCDVPCGEYKCRLHMNEPEWTHQNPKTKPVTADISMRFGCGLHEKDSVKDQQKTVLTVFSVILFGSFFS